MRKIIFLLCLMVFVFCLPVRAAMVYMKDGSVVEGDILSKGRYSIKVQQGEEVHTIYADEYDRIDEGFLAHEFDVDTSEFIGISESKVKAIMRFVQSSGTHADLVKNIEVVVQQAPDADQPRMRELFNVNDIIAALVPIYDRHFTEEELNEICGFYESPTGVKLIDATTQITEEVMAESVKFIQTRMQQGF